jgi:hypothetical protein
LVPRPFEGFGFIEPICHGSLFRNSGFVFGF